MPRMENQPNTVADALRANVATLMEWRGIHAAQLGRRMAAIGFDGWKHRKTAVRFLRPTRQARKTISPDELVGLALVLETTVEMLLSGDIDEASEHIRATGYTVGTWRLVGGEVLNTVADADSASNPTALTPHGIRWSRNDSPNTQGIDVNAKARATLDDLRSIIEEGGVPVPDDYYSMSLDDILGLLREERGES